MAAYNEEVELMSKAQEELEKLKNVEKKKKLYTFKTKNLTIRCSRKERLEEYKKHLK